ncbi:MAG TPA: DNA-3-methyladenine glycosylase [Longimicrobiales bacterium]|nr:DNA-3-methyladenine glycosylase [Longimicrobiales bacterium]
MIAQLAAYEPLPAGFYDRPAEVVARELLGAILVSVVDGELTTGRIVETEAYPGPHDPASHAAERIGRTARNEPMFGPPGIAYVYRIYGIHWCLNAVTGRVGYPAAVLIRAVEPLEGVEVMRRRRFGVGGRAEGRGREGRARKDRELTSGPGRLAQAFAITGALDRHPLQAPPLLITAGTPVDPSSVATGPRIGITRAVDLPLRFYVRANPWVSR